MVTGTDILTTTSICVTCAVTVIVSDMNRGGTGRIEETMIRLVQVVEFFRFRLFSEKKSEENF